MDFMENKEYQELFNNFQQGLPEDVSNWDSFIMLIDFVHEHGYKEGKLAA